MTNRKLLRDQLRLYEREGFTVETVEQASRHYKVKFQQIREPQFLTANNTDWRAYRNNICRLKRLVRDQEKGSA